MATIISRTDDTVTISKDDYYALEERDTILLSLEAAGVDNWDGCDHASDIRAEWDNEDGN